MNINQSSFSETALLKSTTCCRSRAKQQAGFIITIELMLIITILGIGLLVGVVAIRDALFKHYVNKQSQEIYVSDANNRLLGKAIGFDEHEAPLIPYIDRTMLPASPNPVHKNYRALIGVRDDRFTSREPVYYSEANCSGTPCIKTPSNEDADNKGVDGIKTSGAVSYLYALQGAPTYAIGNSNNGQGFLYRQSSQSCPLVASRYISQKVISGQPCEDFSVEASQSTETARICTGSIGENTCPTVGELACDTGGQTSSCSCPAGYEYVNDPILGITDDIYCCPTGSTLQSTGLNINTGLLEYECVLEGADSAVGYTTAEPVINPNDNTKNALEEFQAPFKVNLPTDVGAESWVSIPANGE